MRDFVFSILTIVFFVLSLAYVHACERLH